MRILRGKKYSGFEVTCPDCDLKSALDHAARDKKASYFVISYSKFESREHSSYVRREKGAHAIRILNA